MRKLNQISKIGGYAKKGLRYFWGPIVALIFVASPLGVFAKGSGVDNPTVNPAAYYSVSLGAKSMSDKTLTVNGSMTVSNFVGREDEQYVKFSWGDGAVESLRMMNMVGYLKSSSLLKVTNFTMTHTYSTEGSWLVNFKVYHGTKTGAELNNSDMGQYSFETENTRAACSDVSDNDKDGQMDLNDSDCQKFRHVEDTAELCGDNVDNDINGKTDLYDANCAAFIPKENTAEACSDGLDNDIDGKVDLFDADCAAFRPSENTAELCADGFDNDYDGKADMKDADCLQFAPPENTLALCSDNIDNDFDGLMDGRDPDCIGQVPTEDNAAVCLDGQDNDFDGRFDWNDPDCAPFVQPSNCPVGFLAFFIPGFGFICGANAGY